MVEEHRWEALLVLPADEVRRAGSLRQVESRLGESLFLGNSLFLGESLLGESLLREDRAVRLRLALSFPAR